MNNDDVFEYNYMFDIENGLSKINSIESFVEDDEYGDIVYIINNTSIPLHILHNGYYEKYYQCKHFMKGDGFAYVEPFEDNGNDICILLKNLDSLKNLMNRFIDDFKDKNKEDK